MFLVSGGRLSIPTMILLVFRFSFFRPDEHIVIYQTEFGSIAVQLSLMGETIVLQTEMRYANGWPHHAIYKRGDGHVSLQVHLIVLENLNSGSTDSS